MKYLVKFAFTFLMLSSAQANANLIISSIEMEASGGGRAFFSSIDFSLQWPGQSDRLFELALVEADSGQRFRLNSGTEFDQMAGFLANGVDETLGIRTGNSGRGANESLYFPGLNDLPPFQITSIDLVINSITIDTPGRDPNGDGVWTDFSLNFHIEVFGQPSNVVSEPALPILLGLGLMQVLVRRNRKS